MSEDYRTALIARRCPSGTRKTNFSKSTNKLRMYVNLIIYIIRNSKVIVPCSGRRRHTDPGGGRNRLGGNSATHSSDAPGSTSCWRANCQHPRCRTLPHRMPRAPSPATTLLPVLLLLLSSSKMLLMAGTYTSSSHSSSFISATNSKTNFDTSIAHHHQHYKRSSSLTTVVDDISSEHSPSPPSKEERSLHAINPWLPATDVSAASAVSCPRSSSPQQLCPPPCVSSSSTQNNSNQKNKHKNNVDTNNSTQCLEYLQELHIEEVCGDKKYPDSKSRRDKLRGLRMRHCCEHAVDSALPEAAFDGGSVCKKHLESLFQVDQIASRLSCNHADLLVRYDCSQNFSIAHDCQDCKVKFLFYVLLNTFEVCLFRT